MKRLVFRVAMVGLMCLCGCGSETEIKGGTAHVEQDTTAKQAPAIEETRIIDHWGPDGKTPISTDRIVRKEAGGSETKTVASATGTGPSGKTKADKDAKLDINGSAPAATLPGAGAGGGDTHGKGEATGFDPSSMWVRILLGVLGAAFLAAGAFGSSIPLLSLTSKGVTSCLVIGGVLVTVAMIPAILWFVAIGGLLVVGGLFVYHDAKSGKATESLRALAESVYKAPGNAGAAVMAHFAGSAEPNELHTVNTIVRQDGLDRLPLVPPVPPLPTAAATVPPTT